MANPVSHAAPLAMSTKMWSGLMSLWIRPLLVDPADDAGDADGDAQKRLGAPRPPEQAAQQLAAGIIEQEHRAPMLIRKRARFRRPRWLELLAQRVFMLQPLECSRRRPLRGGASIEDRIGVLSAMHRDSTNSSSCRSVSIRSPSGPGSWMHWMWSRMTATARSTRARLMASSRADSGFFSTSLAPDSRARCHHLPAHIAAHSRIGIALPDSAYFADQRRPRHAGHALVGDHRIETLRLGAEGLERRDAGGEPDRHVAQLLEGLGREPRRAAPRRPRSAPARDSRAALRAPRARRCPRRHRYAADTR